MIKNTIFQKNINENHRIIEKRIYNYYRILIFCKENICKENTTTSMIPTYNTLLLSPPTSGPSSNRDCSPRIALLGNILIQSILASSSPVYSGIVPEAPVVVPTATANGGNGMTSGITLVWCTTRLILATNEVDICPPSHNFSPVSVLPFLFHVRLFLPFQSCYKNI